MRTGRELGGSEAGETLVELMITVAIMGLSMVAILGAIWTTLRVADLNSKTSSADTVLRAYAETLSQGCTLSDPSADPADPGDPSTDCTGPDNTYHYVPCTTAGAQVAYPVYTPQAPYQGYTATITKIRYLDYDPAHPELSYGSDHRPVWVDACPGSGEDGGLQELTLRVTSSSSDPEVKGSETVTIVKRDARHDVPAGSA